MKMKTLTYIIFTTLIIAVKTSFGQEFPGLYPLEESRTYQSALAETIQEVKKHPGRRVKIYFLPEQLHLRVSEVFHFLYTASSLNGFGLYLQEGPSFNQQDLYLGVTGWEEKSSYTLTRVARLLRGVQHASAAAIQRAENRDDSWERRTAELVLNDFFLMALYESPHIPQILENLLKDEEFVKENQGIEQSAFIRRLRTFLQLRPRFVRLQKEINVIQVSYLYDPYDFIGLPLEIIRASEGLTQAIIDEPYYAFEVIHHLSRHLIYRGLNPHGLGGVLQQNLNFLHTTKVAYQAGMTLRNRAAVSSLLFATAAALKTNQQHIIIRLGQAHISHIMDMLQKSAKDNNLPIDLVVDPSILLFRQNQLSDNIEEVTADLQGRKIGPFPYPKAIRGILDYSRGRSERFRLMSEKWDSAITKASKASSFEFKEILEKRSKIFQQAQLSVQKFSDYISLKLQQKLDDLEYEESRDLAVIQKNTAIVKDDLDMIGFAVSLGYAANAERELSKMTSSWEHSTDVDVDKFKEDMVQLNKISRTFKRMLGKSQKR